jgi:hypothetical protein
MYTSNVQLSIDMSRFGLSFTVPTDIEQVNEILHSFDTEPDEYFFEGKGKQAQLINMDEFLSFEDDFFAEDTLRQVEFPERWSFFLKTCVAYACLSTYLADTALPLELAL